MALKDKAESRNVGPSQVVDNISRDVPKYEITKHFSIIWMGRDMQKSALISLSIYISWK